MIDVVCPRDGTVHHAEEAFLGMVILCQKCGTVLKIERQPPASPSPEEEPEAIPDHRVGIEDIRRLWSWLLARHGRLIGILVTVVVLSVLLLVMGFLVRVLDVAYPYLLVAAGAATVCTCVVFLPMLFLRRVRRISGWGLWANAALVAVLVWVQTFLCTVHSFGSTITLFGLLFLGLGIIPLAFVACLWHHYWTLLGALVLECIIVAATTHGANVVLH